MLQRKKYVFLLVTTSSCPWCQQLKSDVGVDGWNMIKLLLDYDSRLETIELAINNFNTAALDGTNREKLKPFIHFYPSFVLVSYNDFHDNNKTTIDGKIYGYSNTRIVDGYRRKRDSIMDWVDETIPTIPASFVPLNKTEKILVHQLLCLTYMPCLNLGGNCIKNYIPRFLF